MRIWIAGLFVLVLFVAGCGGGDSETGGEIGDGGDGGNTATGASIFIADPEGGVYPVNEILVSVVDGTTAEEVEGLAALVDGEVFESFPEINAYFLRLPSLTIADLSSARLVLDSDSRVEFTTTNNVSTLTSRPLADLDQFRQSQLSQPPTPTVAYELVKVFEAWDLIWGQNTPLSPVAVGIIDSGIDANHPEFRPVNITGLLEDLGGLTMTKKWVPSHGTEVAGIIGAANQLSLYPTTPYQFPQMNGILAGITDDFSLYSAQFGGGNLVGGAKLDEILASIRRAIQEGDAQIVNMSFGAFQCKAPSLLGWEASNPCRSVRNDEQFCVKKEDFSRWKSTYEELFGEYKDVLFVAAAGNCNIEAIWNLPGGGAGAPNLISVAATTTQEDAEWWPKSNGWKDGALATGDGEGIDIAAPGEYVWTTTLYSREEPLSVADYRYFGGTSAATPMVTGVAAMIKAINPELSPASIKAIIKETASLPCEPGISSGCLLDARAAVVIALAPLRELNLKVEDIVEVGIANASVLDVPAGMLLGVQDLGSQGVVVLGPAYAGGTWWWKVDFDSGADGWVSDSYLSKVVTTPQPPIMGGTLNDSGITFCGETSLAAGGNNDPCTGLEPWGQDAHYGRDAQAVEGWLTKIGGGSAGFDFTKIANNGNALSASAPLGNGPTDWACTRDNVTGLIWEVKKDDPNHLRHQGHTYTWYDPDNPNGEPGTPNGGTCVSSDCDTSSFVQAVNSEGLCGASDWRMPTPRELQGIVDHARFGPAIEIGYFPNTLSEVFWSGFSYASGFSYRWGVTFYDGSVDISFQGDRKRVRLVRTGQKF